MNKFSMRVKVPHSVYGECQFFIPKQIQVWLNNLDIDYFYVGSDSWGTGYDSNGISTKNSVYNIHNINETDAVAFKIQFPDCKVHLFKEKEYA